MAVNQENISEKQIKDILTYINGLSNNKQVRMMFMCSLLGGMRSINFRSLILSEVYKPDGSVRDSIYLKSDKNKGKFPATYYINKQLRKEFEGYFPYLEAKWGDKLNPETYLFTPQKRNKSYNPRSVYKIFSSVYKKFFIHAATHAGRHYFITRLIDNGINPFIAQKLANHRSVQTTQRYYNSNSNKLQAAVDLLKI